MTEPIVPPDMEVVTREAFFQFIWTDPRDIMPSNHYDDFTEWKDQRTGSVLGRSTPGWKHPGDSQVWMLKKGAAK